jgi:hypothetical protein
MRPCFRIAIKRESVRRESAKRSREILGSGKDYVEPLPSEECIFNRDGIPAADRHIDSEEVQM